MKTSKCTQMYTFLPYKFQNQPYKIKTRPDTRQTSRGRLGRSSSAKTTRNSKLWRMDGRTDGRTDGRMDLPTDMARCRVACPRLKIHIHTLSFALNTRCPLTYTLHTTSTRVHLSTRLFLYYMCTYIHHYLPPPCLYHVAGKSEDNGLKSLTLTPYPFPQLYSW